MPRKHIVKKLDWQRVKRTKASFIQDDNTITLQDKDDIHYISLYYGTDDCTTEKIREGIEEIKNETGKRRVLRIVLMQWLEDRNLVYKETLIAHH